MKTNYATLIEMLESGNADDIDFGEAIFLNMSHEEISELMIQWGIKEKYKTINLSPNLFEHLKKLQEHEQLKRTNELHNNTRS